MTGFLKIKLLRLQEVLKVCIFEQTFSPIYLLQEAETEESIFTEKFIYRSIQIP